MGTAEGLTSCQLWEVGASWPLMLWVRQAQAWDETGLFFSDTVKGIEMRGHKFPFRTGSH